MHVHMQMHAQTQMHVCANANANARARARAHTHTHTYIYLLARSLTLSYSLTAIPKLLFKDTHYITSICLAGHTLNISMTLLTARDRHLLHKSLATHQQKAAIGLSKHQK
jgi:hypothetical protein